MRKLFTLILGVLFATGLFAQNPEAVIKKTDVKPVIDGVFDDVWATTDSNAILRPYYNDPSTPTTPTLGEPGETYWKALWDADGFYLIVNVADDNYFPNYAVTPAGNPWDYDKPEIYFDVNYVLRDAMGPSTGGSGHYQFAPDMTAAKIDGLNTTETDGRQHAFKVEDPAYVAEYFVPWSWLKDKEGVGVDRTGQIGFDVMINDNDPSTMARHRAIWGADNTQGTGEAWTNMDESGIITLEGAEAGEEVSEINLTGGTITTDNGTLQIGAEVLPEDAEVKTLTWSVATAEGSTGRATISSTGLLTAIMDGVVTVTAKAQDASFLEQTVDVTISGQVIQVADVNIIRNGNFDLVNETSGAPLEWGGWIDGTYGQPYAVVDGAASLTVDQIHATEPWHYQFSQSNLTAMPDIPYILKFKAWASKERQINFDFEDTSANGYNRYGVSTDVTSTGESEWNLDLTTEPQWFTLNVTFTEMIPSTVQKIQFMLSKDDGTVFLDSMSLISEADMALVPAIDQRLATFEIYPNPADTKLHISLNTENTVVAIYNSVGVKMEEVLVPGTHHIFDVSRYTKGLYFVKANNSVMKFVK
ncbi:MAG: sugar-binding protein [Draconibacterium sp.]